MSVGAPDWWQNSVNVPEFHPPHDAFESLLKEPRPYVKYELLKTILRCTRYRLFTSSRHVVLGGGALYGVMYIGALMHLCHYSRSEYAKWAARVSDVAGTSAGALIGLMVVTGMDPWLMRRCVHTCGLAKLLQGMLDANLNMVVEQLALSSGAAADGMFQQFVAAITGRSDTTFLELHARTRRRFVVVVTSGVHDGPEYWSHLTKPDMPVWLALRCTTSVPGLFAPPVINGVLYFDGGLACNLPCHIFPPSSTLSLFVNSRASKEPVNIRTLLMKVISAFTASSQVSAMRSTPMFAFRAVPCVTSSALPLGAFQFDAAGPTLDALIIDGIRSVQAVMLRDAYLVVLSAVELFARRKK